MKQSVGGAFTINLIAIFIVLVFAFLAGTLSYTKAFRINSRIVNAIERYEGYNSLAKTEIENISGNFSYLPGNSNNCANTKNGGTLVKLSNEKYKYCIYYFGNDGSSKYYSYGVVTYMYLELPIIGYTVNIPIYSKTNRIYKFG